MRRPIVRFSALAVLTLLGAPLAVHFLIHDLHHHQDVHYAAEAYTRDSGHGDHEHPIVSNTPPQVRSVARATLPAIAAPALARTTWTRTALAGRNAMSHGAVRLDNDVGPQALLSTFLI